jgi:hypothetical protein
MTYATLADGSPIPNYLTQSRRNITINPVRSTILSRVGEHKFFCYSGVVVGDVTVPATISLISVADTGQDSHMEIYPFYAQPITSSTNNALGFIVKINDVEIIKEQVGNAGNYRGNDTWSVFVPRQSKLEIISLNTAANNTQERGCNIVGEYL